MEKWIIEHTFSTTVATQLIFCLRILVSILCGCLIGIERTKRFKAAGIRTHCVVACGSALLMIVSKFAFSGFALDKLFTDGVKQADPARIAAQVVTGVGFLGTAIVFKQHGSINGLTTAAGIWTTAAVGLAVGAGMYVPGLFCTGIIIALSALLHQFSFGYDAYSQYEIQIVLKNDDDARKQFMEELSSRGVIILSTDITRMENGLIRMHFMARMKNEITYDEVCAIMKKIPEIVSLSV